MDINAIRKLALRALRLADVTGDPQEAAKLRLQAADYLEKAEQQPLPPEQAQPSK
jgi:hypothetical protein